MNPRPPILDSPALQRYGLPELVYGTQPAAAADFVQAMTGAFHVRLLSVFCRIVTDATVASREVVVEYRDQQAQRFALAGAPTTVLASTTTDYAFNVFQDQADWPSDSTILAPLSPLMLPPGCDFRIHVVSVQAGDQLSRIRFMWERFYSDVAAPGREPSAF